MITGNATNGLFVRIDTPTGGSLEQLVVPARFDDTDIVHVLGENLLLDGSPGGLFEESKRPSPIIGLAKQPGAGSLASGNYQYSYTFIDAYGFESPGSLAQSVTGVASGSAIKLSNISAATGNYVGRVLYRSFNGGPFKKVAELDKSSRDYTDTLAAPAAAAPTLDVSIATVRHGRLDASLVIDPGMIIKNQGARIQLGFGTTLLAEGNEGNEVIFTSRADDRYGAGGTFDTNGDLTSSGDAGNWAGIYASPTSRLSLDHSLIAFAGGITGVGGGTAAFNPIQIHQAEARIANSVFEQNDDGTGGSQIGARSDFAPNSAATIHVTAAQPTIVGNTFVGNNGGVIDINVNALNSGLRSDGGRQTGPIDRYSVPPANQGPVVRGNQLENNEINGMVIRGEVLATEVVWDDTDIVHVLDSDIEIPDLHTFGGMRIESSSTESLVVKVDGAEILATGRSLDIVDRIGGRLMVLGQPGFPVVMTSINDDTVGAGFTPSGEVQTDTMRGAGAASPGDWQGLKFDPYSHDRNVAAVTEREGRIGGVGDLNANVGQHQELGTLAANEKSGDENIRLGFEVYGAIAAPQDQDLYSFQGTAGTMVWFDVDRTDAQLDTVLELLDGEGRVLALSQDSRFESLAGQLTFVNSNLMRDGHALPMQLDHDAEVNATGEYRDLFSQNDGDSGMRIVLPGTTGTRNTFYVRVRSSNPAANLTSLAGIDASRLMGGTTQGGYQFQIRLSETDEFPGSVVRYADLRYATDAIVAIGLPAHSPLAGELFNPGGTIDLGSLGNTDRGAISIAGVADNTVDVYTFTVDRDSLQGLNPTPNKVSTVFDIDWADGLTRPDTNMYLFDGNNLIAIGTNSNILDDQITPIVPGQPTTESDLSRGSQGTRDAFIGPLELNPNGDYQVIVGTTGQMPADMTQFTQINPVNTNARLEPLDPTVLIIDDRFDYAPTTNNNASEGTPVQPRADQETQSLQVVFENDGSNIIPWQFGDIPLLAIRENSNNASRLSIYNPFTGRHDAIIEEATSVPIGAVAQSARGDIIAIRNEGNATRNDANTSTTYSVSADGVFTAIGATGIETYEWALNNANPPVAINNRDDEGMVFDSLAYYSSGTSEARYLYGLANRGTFTGTNVGTNGTNDTIGAAQPNLDANNLIYRLDPNDGTAISRAGRDMTGGFESANPLDPRIQNNYPNFSFPPETPWAGTNIVAQIQIPTDSPNTGLPTGNVTDLVTDINGGQFLYAFTDTGAVWQASFSENSNSTYASGDIRGIATLIVDPTVADDPLAVEGVDYTAGVDFITDSNGNKLVFERVSLGPENFRDVNDTIGISDLYFGVGRATTPGTPVSSSTPLRYYAFDLTTRTAQPIFEFGADSILVDNTSTSGEFAGLFFSSLDSTLWHLSDTLRTEPGHGVNSLDDRASLIGGGSLRFGFDDLSDDFNHLSHLDQDGDGRVSDNSDSNDDLDADDLQGFSGYNFLGGAHGSVQSNTLDLSGFSAADLPTLYFTYLLDSENTNADNNVTTNSDAGLDDVMRDSLRVMVAGDDGQWQLVATNNFDDAINNRVWDDIRGADHEYDPIGSNGYTNVFQQRFVQELFDDDVFRQARIDLGPWAGQQDVKIRFEFSTAGEARPDQSEIQAIFGHKLTDGQTLVVSGEMPDRLVTNQGDVLPTLTKSFEFDLGLVVQMPAGSQVTAPLALQRPDGNTIVELVPGVAGLGQISVSPTDTAADVAQKVAAFIAADGDLTTTTVSSPSKPALVNFNSETQVGAYTFAGLESLIQSTPGVAATAVAIDVDISMNPVQVRNAIQFALANEIHYLDAAPSLAAFPVVGSTNAVRLYDLAISQTSAQGIVSQPGNDTLATAQNLDGESWSQSLNTNIANSLARPHLTVQGVGDGTYDYYSFTVDSAGATATFDIDDSLFDLELHLYDSAGNPLATDDDDDSGNDPGPSAGLDPFLQHTFLSPGTYVIGVAAYNSFAMAGGISGAAVPNGASYSLHVSIDGKPVASSSGFTPLTLINGENAAGSNLPGSDFGVYTGSRSTSGLLRAGERSRGLGGANGVYIDDIVIGLAERGESFTGGTQGTALADNPYFEARYYNPITGIVGPVQQEITAGPYQLEIRLGQEYLGANNIGKDLRFDLNQRLADGLNMVVQSSGSQIVDGDTFEISNGFETVRFEFNDVTVSALTTPADSTNFVIEYRVSDTAAQVAQTIRNAINSGSVRAALGVEATTRSGTLTDGTDPVIVFHGYAAASNLGSIDFTSPESGHTHLLGVITGGNVVLGEDNGDQNLHRDQGQFIVDSNVISFSSGTALNLSASDVGPGNKVPDEGDRPKPGAVQNFPTINSEQLIPGAIVQNNLLINNGNGILLGGNTTSGGPSAFSRVVNNTVFNSGTGIQIQNGAAPTLLNNVLVDNAIGIRSQNAGPTVVRGTLYQGNGTTVIGTGVGTEAVVNPAGPLFVNPNVGVFDLAAGSPNFYPAAGSPLIDSSIESQVDRPSIVSVKNSVGISQSPIVVSERDLAGQIRKNSSTSTGQGNNVDIDRGALDRSDTTGPKAQLISPNDNDAANIDVDPSQTFLQLTDGVYEFFEILITEGSGIGPDSSTIGSNQIVLIENGVDLVSGIDYTIGYNTATRTLRLTPISGIWRPDATYQIILNNEDALQSDGSTIRAISDLAGNPLQPNRATGETRFTILMPDVKLDYGDAPASYGTLLSDSGARHTINNNRLPRLGQFVDVDINGNPSPASDDDLVSVSVTSSNAVFSIVNSAANATKRVTLNAVPSGGEVLTIDIGGVVTKLEFITGNLVPSSNNVAVAFNLTDTVEEVTAKLLTAIRTRVAASGDSVVVSLDSSQQNSLTITAVDDEDGVATGIYTAPNGSAVRVFAIPGAGPDAVTAEQTLGYINPLDPAGANVNVDVIGAGLLDAWIDFDQSGTFESSEQIFAGTPVIQGSNLLTIAGDTTAYAAAINGETWMRFRISAEGNLGPTGVAVGGEVEDYPISIRRVALPTPIDDSFNAVEDTVLDVLAGGAQGTLFDNDTGLSGQLFPVRYFLGALPQNGTIEVVDRFTGEFRYTPNEDFYGQDTFTYRLSTQENVSQQATNVSTFATVTINIAPVNDPPAAMNQAFVTTEDTTLTITAAELLVGAAGHENPAIPQAPFDESNQTLRVVSITGGDLATGTTIDQSNASTTAITVEGGSLTATFDVDGSLIAVQYTPKMNFNSDNLPPTPGEFRLDEFLFTVEDDGVLVLSDGTIDPAFPNPLTTVATASIRVTPQNDAPFLATDSVSIDNPAYVNYFTSRGLTAPVPTEDQSLVIPAAFLLENDSSGPLDAADENQAIRGNDGAIRLVNPVALFDPTLGTLTLSANGDLLFTPTADVYGQVLFTYTVIDQGVDEAVDGTRTSAPLTSNVTSTIFLEPVNDVPVAFNRSLTLDEVAEPAGPAVLTFTAADLINGKVGEQPNRGGNFAASLPAPYNETNQALRVVAFASNSNTVDVNSLAGGSGQLTLTTGIGGILTFNFTNGAFVSGTYAPPVDYNERTPFNPNDFFTYTIADDGATVFGGGIADRDLVDERSTTPATVTLTVTETNDPPVFQTIPVVDMLERDDSLSTTIPAFVFNQTPGPVTALDEIDVQTLSFTIVDSLSTVPAGLMLQSPRVLADGSLEVFPAPDQFGTATYVVRATDAEPNNPAFNDPRSTDKTFVLNVRPVNDAPRLNSSVLGTSGRVVPAGPNPIIDQAYAVGFDGTITYTLREDNTQALGDTSQAFFIPINRPAATSGYSQIGLLDVFTPGPANEVAALPGGSQTLELFDFPETTALGGQLTSVFSGGVLIGVNYVPPTNFNNAIGSADTFTYTVRDKSGTGNETYSLAAGSLVPDRLTSINQVRLNLNPVNDRPEFEISQPSIEVPEDGAAVTINNYAFNINAGPPFNAFDEIDPNTGQNVTFTVTSLGFASDQAAQFFSQFPSIDANGRLTFRPAANAFGKFQFEIVATDNGPGNATRGDLISSLAKTMTIEIQPVNDPPRIDPAVTPLQFTMLEDGEVEIRVRGDSTNPGLLDVFAVGPANEASNVTPGGNQTLSLGTPIPVTSLNGGTLTQVLGGSGEVVALRYKPRANFTGNDSIIYTVSDDGVTVDVGTGGTVRSNPRIASNTVAINVLPVNDAPIFSGAGDVVSIEDQDTGLGRGVVRVPDWATNVQAGPAGATDELEGAGAIEAQQTEFVITQISGNTSLFSVAPNAIINGSSATLAYTLAPDAAGQAVFTAQLRDNGPTDAAIGDDAVGDTQTFTISVTAVNDPPTFANAGDVTVDEDSGPYNAVWATQISPGPADESSQTVVFNVTVPEASKSLFASLPVISESGVLRFTPALNAVGAVTVVVNATDSGEAISPPVSFQIKIGEVNDPPRPLSDVLDPSDEDTVLTISAAQLLANDGDPDLLTNPSESLTLVMPAESTSVSGATVKFDAVTQTITYNPLKASVLQALAPGKSLTDSFSYTVRDAAGVLSAPVVVRVVINGINDAPTLVADNPVLAASGSTIIRPLDNDSDIDGQIDPASVRLELQPVFGSVQIDLNGVITYTPFASFSGKDTFSYTVADNLGLRSIPAVITIDANPAPIAKSDVAGTFVDEAVVINVAANDSDENGTLNLASIRIVSAPGRGDAVPLADGKIRYIPATGFVGRDSFTYSIADNEGRFSTPATVSVQVVASRLQNPNDFSDVNADGDVSALDALLIINKLMLAGGNVSSIPVQPGDQGPNYFDVSGDRQISALDALQVINQLMLRGPVPASGSGELAQGESIVAAASTVTPLALMTSETVAVMAEPDSAFALAPRPDKSVAIGADNSPADVVFDSSVDLDAYDWIDSDAVDLIADEREADGGSDDTVSALDSAFLDFE
ncbi:DVUA0089 family protein [Novipirellula sp.]|uniref:DVUA0089 family protein n=1 Tax=Novipirellula sp. TaxID=2795430 RepID=UPI00356159F7